MPNPTCTIPACTKPARSSAATLCAMHYHRQYRHGSTDAKPQAMKTGTPRAYKAKYVPHHPLAGAYGQVYTHRLVLFGEIGHGVHACHWCSTDVEWMLPIGDPRNLQVDHLNEDKSDNRIANLVPSCRSCNTARSMARRTRELRASGAWSANDTIASLRDGRPINRFQLTA